MLEKVKLAPLRYGDPGSVIFAKGGKLGGAGRAMTAK